MKQIVLILAVAILAAGCSAPTPDPGAIQTALAETQAAAPTIMETAIPPTEAPAPTNTEIPEPTNTPTLQNTATQEPTVTETRDRETILEESRAEICKNTISSFEDHPDVDSVTLCRFADGYWEVELRTSHYTKDSQPDVSYSIVRAVAPIFSDWDQDMFATLLDGDPAAFKLITYSAEGDYRYESATNLTTMKRLANREISYDEWILEAEAGFK